MRAPMIWRAILAALSFGVATPAPADDALLASHKELQQRDQQLLDVGWRLVTANAPFCANAAPAIGLLLQDMRSYGKQADKLRTSLGLEGDIAVQAVATGSPADRTGLQANQEIAAVGEFYPLDERPSDEPGWKRLTDLHESIDAFLATDGEVLIGLSKGITKVITGTPACTSRFEVLDSGSKAMAEGSRVLFGKDFPGFAYDEGEFAAAVAHELAHNLLAHRAWLSEHGRKRTNIRLTEREADRLMPWLLANAGYEPHSATRFMKRWGPAHGGWIFRKRTHDGWDERAEFIDAEVALIEQLRDDEGRADWATHFKREVEP